MERTAMVFVIMEQSREQDNKNLNYFFTVWFTM